MYQYKTSNHYRIMIITPRCTNKTNSVRFTYRISAKFVLFYLVIISWMMKPVLMRIRFPYAIKTTKKRNYIAFPARWFQNNAYYFNRIEFLSFKVVYQWSRKLRTTRASVGNFKIRVGTNKRWSKQQFFSLFSIIMNRYFFFFFLCLQPNFS